ncbi:hypothetical protein BW687_021775 [Pseudomonas graminis]|uniref:hypothetical protein n=1 Tax=Pseudomonas graminis TaxID=158627 RepID=UPI00234BF4B9|nr:hypothetical protein [Pseudomonas graminis]MDC6382800.1 hypothetical protein [Pseudomonas graminis]
MKRISSGYKESRFAAGEARWLNHLRRRGKKYVPGKVEPAHVLIDRDVFIAPRYISIYEFEQRSSPYNETMAFLDQIRKKYKRRSCLVDFSKTEKISAAALVVVYAAIEMAGTGRNGVADIAMSVKSPAVNTALKTNNLHKLIRGHKITYALSDARHLPIVSSVGREQMDEIVDFIQTRIFEDRMSPDKEHVYGDAVSETINNVRLHAYPNQSNDKKRWWLMCNTFGKKLYLAIYDCGVGIPKTVVEQPWFFPLMKYTDPDLYAKITEEIPDFEKSGVQIAVPVRVSDERLIYFSMQNDVSGTQKEKHGQGSKSIKALVNDTDGGVLWVFSNNGLYTFTQKDQRPREAKLRSKFPGTLVQWNIEI